MKVVWADKGIMVSGETDQEIDAIRSFFKFFFDLKGIHLGLESGNGKDLYTLLGLPEPVND